MSLVTPRRLRLSGGTELSFTTAGEASSPAVLLLHGLHSSIVSDERLVDFATGAENPQDLRAPGERDFTSRG